MAADPDGWGWGDGEEELGEVKSGEDDQANLGEENRVFMENEGCSYVRDANFSPTAEFFTLKNVWINIVPLYYERNETF